MRHIRTTLLIAAVALWTPLASPALGQIVDTLRVVDFSIADGTASVSLDAQVRVTFNHPVNLEYLGDVFGVEPAPAVDTTAIELQDGGRTVVLTLQHEPNTDYVWFGFGYYETYDESVVSMYVEPFIRHYTTASSMGPLSVSGRVVEAEFEVDAAGKRSSPSVDPRLPAVIRDVVHDVARQLRAEVEPARLASASEANGHHTMVFMLDSDYLDEDEEDETYSAPLAGTVVDAEDGAYAVRYLRDGIVWPFVLRLGEMSQWFDVLQVGFFDPNADGVPDSLDLAGQSWNNINLTFFDFTMGMYDQATAHAVADAAMSASGTAQVIVSISASLVQPDGRAAEWTFVYRDAEDNVTEVYVYGLGSEVEMAPVGPLSGLSDLILDSHVGLADALATARSHGGAQFESENDMVTLMALAGPYAREMAGVGDIFELPLGTNPYWTFFYLGFDNDTEFGVVYQAYFVDMVTGAFLGSDTPTSMEENVHPALIRLSSGYPNPFLTEVAFTLELEQAGLVRATVYDVLGREVSIFTDAVLPADTHTLRWNAGSLPAGAYFVRVEAAGQLTTRPVVLQH